MFEIFQIFAIVLNFITCIWGANTAIEFWGEDYFVVYLAGFISIVNAILFVLNVAFITGIIGE